MRVAAILLGALLLGGCDGGTEVTIPTPSAPSTITVTSPAFTDGGSIPARYTCDGAGISPPLDWTGVPADAETLALVVSDPDAPRGTFLHWLVYDIPPGDGGVAEGTVPSGGREGENSARRTGWFAPCPPSGTHRYVVRVYALDAPVRGGSTHRVMDGITRHTVAVGTLTGLVSAG